MPDQQKPDSRPQYTHPAPGVERRYVGTSRPTLHRRADEPPVIVGYAAVFYRADDPGTEYELWRDAYERIMPGAFDAALREDLVRGLTNHDEQWLLGRSDKRTLRLSVDKVGLRYAIDPPDTQAGTDTVRLLEREDLDGSSFSFRVYGKRGTVKWAEETRDGRTIEIREIYDLELLDVGPVTFPAYEATAAGLRSDAGHLAEARADWQRWRESLSERQGVDIGLELQIAEAIAGAQLLKGDEL